MNTNFHHILVPVDFDAPSDRAVEIARALASPLDAAVHLVHVLEQPFTPGCGECLYSQRRAGLSRIAGVLNEHNIKTSVEVRTGAAVAEILKASIDYGADLIVMGTHARRGQQDLSSGTISEQVSWRASCPVLTVRDHGGTATVKVA
jgi:nucleotide-binding universal stress UspA family protein